MIVTPFLVGVTEAVSGSRSVDRDELMVKLGRPAWHVLQVLWTRRDRNGRTHATRAGIATAKGFVAISEDSAKKGLIRLRDAGLVEDIGWQWSIVPPRDERLKVFWRRVRGAQLLRRREGETFCAVPDTTAKWLRTAVTFGGKRPGAGRKPTDSSGSLDSVSYSSVPATRSNQVYPPISPLSALMITQRKADGILSPNGERKPAATSGVDSDVSYREVTPAGSVIGVARPTGPTQWPPPGVPRFPDRTVIEPAQMPYPPKLSAKDSDAWRLKILTRAFRGAMESEYRGKCWLLAKGLKANSPNGVMLLRAGELLEKFEVAPAAWCVFAIRRWRHAREHTETSAKKKALKPPIKHVFSEKLIAEQCVDGDRRSTVTEYAPGGRVLISPHHRKLGTLYERMRRRIMAGMPAAEAVEAFFPDGLYDELVDQARTDSAETQYRLDTDAKDGKFLW